MSHTCNQVRDKLNTFDERSQQLGLKTHRWKVKRLGRHMEKRISNMGRKFWNTKTASMILTTSPNVFWLVYKNTIASILCPIHINAWEESFKLKRQQMIGMLAINCLRVCPTGGWKAEEKRRINKKNFMQARPQVARPEVLQWLRLFGATLSRVTSLASMQRIAMSHCRCEISVLIMFFTSGFWAWVATWEAWSTVPVAVVF